MIGLAGLVCGSGAKVIGDGGRSGCFPEEGVGEKKRGGIEIAKRR